MVYGDDFKEIAHCGGKYIVTIAEDASGRRGIQLGVEHTTTPGGAVQRLGGLAWGLRGVEGADPRDAVPPRVIGSDTHGLFGDRCPACEGYWRSQTVPETWDITSPYCGTSAETFQFLTAEQLRFVRALCELAVEAYANDRVGRHVIDMDPIADSVATKPTERPLFYYAEWSQQNRYTCGACGAEDDILGRYGYCSSCGTRNDLQELTRDIEAIQAKTRERHAAKEPLERAEVDAVSAFDSAARQYAKQLAERVPMKSGRRDALGDVLFHNLKKADAVLQPWFGIDLFKGFAVSDAEFIRRMFLRRHVYEHGGGQVTERYLEESGDTTVRLRQSLREDIHAVFQLTGFILKMARNLHEGFHELFPPTEAPITMHRKQQALLNKVGQSR